MPLSRLEIPLPDAGHGGLRSRLPSQSGPIGAEAVPLVPTPMDQQPGRPQRAGRGATMRALLDVVLAAFSDRATAARRGRASPGRSMPTVGGFCCSDDGGATASHGGRSRPPSRRTRCAPGTARGGVAGTRSASRSRGASTASPSARSASSASPAPPAAWRGRRRPAMVSGRAIVRRDRGADRGGTAAVRATGGPPRDRRLRREPSPRAKAHAR